MASRGNTFTLTVHNIADALVSFTSIRLYRAASRGGVTTQFDSITLVAGTSAYTYNDPTGLPTDWYRYDLHGGSFDSDLSPWFPGSIDPAYTQLQLRRKVTERLSLYGRPPSNYSKDGPSATTTGTTGAAGTFVSTQYINALLGARRFQGWYALVLDGARAGDEVQINTIVNTTGVFTMAGSFGAALASGVSLDFYGMMPSQFWNRMIRRSMHDLWVPFGHEIAGIDQQTRYVLPAFIQDEDQIELFVARSGDTEDRYTYAEMDGWEIRPSIGGGMELFVSGGLQANALYVLRGWRTPAELEADTDSVVLTDQDLDVLILGACARAADEFAGTLGGSLEDRSAWERRHQRLESERQAARREYRSWESATAIRSPLVEI